MAAPDLLAADPDALLQAAAQRYIERFPGVTLTCFKQVRSRPDVVDVGIEGPREALIRHGFVTAAELPQGRQRARRDVGGVWSSILRHGHDVYRLCGSIGPGDWLPDSHPVAGLLPGSCRASPEIGRAVASAKLALEAKCVVAFAQAHMRLLARAHGGFRLAAGDVEALREITADFAAQFAERFAQATIVRTHAPHLGLAVDNTRSEV